MKTYIARVYDMRTADAYNTCYDIISDAQGAISSTKGQHVTEIKCCDCRHIICDWGHISAIGVTLMRLELHIGMSFVTGVTKA